MTGLSTVIPVTVIVFKRGTVDVKRCSWFLGGKTPEIVIFSVGENFLTVRICVEVVELFLSYLYELRQIILITFLTLSMYNFFIFQYLKIKCKDIFEVRVLFDFIS